jgi:hypothetical protein
MTIKVYEITLKINDTFCFYLRDDELTLETDEIYPYRNSRYLWNREGNSYKEIKNNCPIIRTYPIIVIKQDYQDHLESVIMEIIKDYTNIIDHDDLCHRNFFVLKKEWEDYYEVSISFYMGKVNCTNRPTREIANRYLSLQAFW